MAVPGTLPGRALPGLHIGFLWRLQTPLETAGLGSNLLLHVAMTSSVKWGIWSPRCLEDHTRPCRKVLGLVTSTRWRPVVQ